MPCRPCVLVEPFAGGGIIALTAVMENLADRAVMAEIDPDVSAVWQVMLYGDHRALIDRILRFQITREAVLEELAEVPQDVVDRAFQTILRNRVQRGGIMAPGASLVKLGEGGKGVASRWYPRTLARRIEAIARVSHKLEFHSQDGLELISTYLSDPSAAFFVDPPYTMGAKKAGKRLYAYNNLDHERLFVLLSRAAGPVMITYADAPEPLALASEFGFSVEKVPMSNTHHTTLLELIITSPPKPPLEPVGRA